MRPLSPEAQFHMAIAQVYDTFSQHTLAPDFPARCSPLGDRQAMAHTLQAAPLKSLDPETLAIYCFKAIYTMGNEADFLYFIPRMLECYALEPIWHLHHTELFLKIGRIIHTWSKQEHDAFYHFMNRYMLFKVSGDWWGEDFFEPIIEANLNQMRIIPSFEELQTHGDSRNLANLVLTFVLGDFPFLEPKLSSWLYSPALYEKLADDLKFYKRRFNQEENPSVVKVCLKEAVELLAPA